MKWLFAGPTLAADRAAIAARHPELRLAPPAARGDLYRATAAGATAIGLVDGLFGSVPAVWHKEILHALSEGVAVAGGASMGALRASECSAFGMVGLGAIHARFASGAELDDAYVAQIHAPAELGHQPLSEAAATIDFTLDALHAAGTIDDGERAALGAANRRVFHADRSARRVAAEAGLAPGRAKDVAAAMIAGRVDIKRADGLAVVDWLVARPDRCGPAPTAWRFNATSQWLAFVDEMDAAMTGPGAARAAE